MGIRKETMEEGPKEIMGTSKGTTEEGSQGNNGNQEGNNGRGIAREYWAPAREQRKRIARE